MRSGRRPIPEGTRLVFAGGTASPMMCPSDEQKDDEKGQTDDKRRWGQRQSRKKQENTATRWCVFVQFVLAWCFEVIRCDIVSRFISWYHVPYHAISQDTIYRDITCIYIPIFWDWYRDIVSRRYSSPQLTLFFAQLGAPSLVHQDNSKQNGYLAVVLLKQWYLLVNIYVRV